MRSATKTFVGLASLGVMVATAKFGLANVSTSSFGAAATTSTTTTSSTTQTATNSGTTSTTTNAGTGTTTTKKKKTKTTKSGTTASTGTGTSTGTTAGTGTSTGGTTTPAPTASAAVSKTGGAVQYVFGTVELKVTKTGNKITSVSCIVCSATNGRQGAFSPLIQAAVSANGSNFGNLGGATYTTNAFKQALDSALAKF